MKLAKMKIAVAPMMKVEMIWQRVIHFMLLNLLRNSLMYNSVPAAKAIKDKAISLIKDNLGIDS